MNGNFFFSFHHPQKTTQTTKKNNKKKMLDQLLNIPKDLLRSFKKLPQPQQLVVLAVLAVGAYWLYKNYIAKRLALETFAEDGNVGTLTCTMYYVDWCPHCKDAKPEWEKLKQSFHGKMLGKKKVLIASVDCEKFPEVAKQQNIGGYPTFKFQLDGKDLDFNGERKYDAFKKYVENIAYSDFQ